MALDARIPLMAQGLKLEPRQNALMRVQQMAGAQQQNALRQMQMQQLQQAMVAEAEQRKAQAAREQEMQGYLASLSGQSGPPQPFNPAEAIQRTGSVDMAAKLQSLLQPKASEGFTLTPGAVRYGPDGKQVAAAPVKPPEDPEILRMATLLQSMPPNDPRRAIVEAAIRKQTTHAPAAQMNNYGSPVPAVDGQGNPVFIRTTKDSMEPAIIPGVRPPKSGAEEKAEAEKKERSRQGQQMMSVMGDAEQILKRGKATASGVGTVADAAARAVGVSTLSAQESARLQALSGWLVANVPRMEGPQSNYDVQNYMTMAGKIGDSTVPIKERMAALDTVRSLQKRYAAINGTPTSESQKPQVVDFGSLK